ncbi:hypothetical protein [Sporosarcina sp. Marseille-Q4943]|uniref:hypothetical protein n=1 Tax=Sporosarcina sp. Marseille-Q4943 TaxID=2942204 RepID=UPI00208DC252|nr:hypothetical protein [Sporosarcina sp. Marseille-Q4943]
MESTVRELLHDAIYYDVPNMAHAVYYAVQQGLVKLDDPESRIPFRELDYEAIGKMREENWLQMCTVKLFVVRMGGKRYAVYLAETEEEVRAQHRKIYGEFAGRVTDASGRMDASYYCEGTGKERSFWELKREVVDFPYFVGEF